MYITIVMFVAYKEWALFDVSFVSIYPAHERLMRKLCILKFLSFFYSQVDFFFVCSFLYQLWQGRIKKGGS